MCIAILHHCGSFVTTSLSAPSTQPQPSDIILRMTDFAPFQILRQLFDIAVAAADPMQCLPHHLPPRPAGRVVVIGAGKASARMAQAVEAQWGRCEGLVITRYGHARPCQGIEIVEAAHPIPDQRGVDATTRILNTLQNLRPDDTVLALISGGGSALLCAPAGDISLSEKQHINAGLLASGAPIDQINTVRKHLSRVKGGRLAAATRAKTLTLIISDVPGDDPADIASGPTVPDRTTPAKARAILDQYNIALPPSVAHHLASPASQQTLHHASPPQIIAAPAQSLAAAATHARQLGLTVHILGDALEGEARDLGAEQARQATDLAKALRPTDAPVLLLSGGECTVTRRGNGVGGPNAEFALSAALTLAGAGTIWGLACDTDGVDGAAEIAGAVFGPDTLRKAGIDAQNALNNNDAHRFFAAAGGQVITGPTFTNVNDFRAFLVMPPKP